MAHPCWRPRASVRRISRSNVPCGRSICWPVKRPLLLLHERYNTSCRSARGAAAEIIEGNVPYTREEGRGPPCFWEFNGYLFESCWEKQNVVFLQNLLETPKNVTDALTKAVDRLSTHSEHAIAQNVLSDLPPCKVRLTERCSALPDALATIPPYSWTDS